jgi:hypothetical protein
MPPEERPEGDVVWIGGYWGWDDDRSDFLWVSGCWRAKPPGKEWVAGYWRQADTQQWQWVPGFWHNDPQQQAPAAQGQAQAPEQAAAVTYYPEPPAPPNMAPPGKPPQDDLFFVPGNWQWNGTTYAWRAGFWARVQPGYVWVPSHYRWTPSGYVFIEGYWDVAVARRGMLYAPVVVDYRVVGATYVYTPTYAVSDTMVLDTMFVRPCACHYYFGDYYEPRYRTLGYESSYVYSTRYYDGIVVYRTYEYRSQPDYVSVQINLFGSRSRGEAPVPPRTFAQQTTIVNNYNTTVVQQNTNISSTQINNTQINNTQVNNQINNQINNTQVNKTVNNNQFQMVAPAKQVAAAKGMTTVPVDNTTRVAAKQAAQATQVAAVTQRKQAENVPPGVAPKAPAAPRVAALKVPPTKSAAALPSVSNPQGLQPQKNALNTTQQNHTAAGHLNQQGATGTNQHPTGGQTNGAVGATHTNLPNGNAALNKNALTPQTGLNNTAGAVNPNLKTNTAPVGTYQNTKPGVPPYQPNQQKTGVPTQTNGTTGQPVQQRPVVHQPPRPNTPAPPPKKDDKDKKKQ